MHDGATKDALIPLFVESAVEHLQTITQGLLECEKSVPPAPDAVQSISRHLHSLKGAAMSMELNNISHLCHAMEDVLRAVQEGQTQAGEEIYNALFEASDVLETLIENLSTPQANQEDGRAMVQSLAALLGTGKVGRPAPASPAPAARRSPSDKQRVLRDTVRVSTRSVDDLLNLAVELVIARNWLKTFSGRFGRMRLAAHGTGQDRVLHMLDSFEKDFSEALDMTDKLVNDTQNLAMDIRMMPLSILFDTLPRAVRDLSKKLGKQVELVLSGSETSLDKKAIEELADPLTHMLRNAIDHGIEPGDRRRAAGKDVCGKVTLTAYQDADRVVIEMTDDGQGVDEDRVRAHALARGVVPEKELKRMTREETLDLLFRPGFSTAGTVTEMSGRGVGLDAVKRNVERLGGNVELDSSPGLGSTLRVRIPLTLATARVFLVRCRKRLFAIPVPSVEQTMHTEKAAIQTVKGRKAIYSHGETVPVVSLRRLLSLEDGSDEEVEEICLLVLAQGDRKLALEVDQIIGIEEIVLKTLGTHLRRTRLISRCSILGTGEVALIVDTHRLFAAAQAKAGTVNRGPTPRPVRCGKKILLVEDQITTRLLEKSILEAAGFEVKAATDGLEALGLLGEAPFDMVITDVQMPRMDGLTLTRRIREDQRYGDLPVIVVSSLDRDEERRLGLEAGADAYLTKTDFRQDVLIQAIHRLIGEPRE